MDKITILSLSIKSYLVLKIIIPKYSDIIEEVVIARDRSLINDYSKEIKELCKKYSVNYIFKSDFKKFKTNYIIIITWRWLVKEKTKKIILFHDSILPKLRGFAPVITTLVKGIKRVGVTAAFAAKDYDTGNIINSFSTYIKYPITIKKALEINSQNYIKSISKILDKLKKNIIIVSKKQNNKKASYSLWRDENDFKIDWSKDADYLERFVNALSYPYKGAYCYLNKKKIRILSAVKQKDVKIENRDFGKIIFIRNDKPVIVCGKGLLKIKTIISDRTKKNILPLSKFRLRFS
ncbi:formyltransferase family protein [Candidatus Pelagibacter sp.]|jgi:methionyl-tRNA formyltransferase|nr:formyltransferase family protein [Candidatus Pelagibacter sp.]